MALESSPALAKTLAVLLSEMVTCFHNEEEFAMTPLGEVQVLVPMNGGAWTSIMSFRLTSDGSPEIPATEDKSKTLILVNPATNVASIKALEAYIKNHDLMLAAQRGHRLTIAKSICISSLQIITKRTNIDEPSTFLWGHWIVKVIENFVFAGSGPAKQTPEKSLTRVEMRNFMSTCVARKAPPYMLGSTSRLVEFEFAGEGLYAACILARETSVAQIKAKFCVLVSTDKSSKRTTSTPVGIHLEAAREKFTWDADLTIDLVIDVDTFIGLVTFPDASAIVAPIHASFRPRTYTLVENAIP